MKQISKYYISQTLYKRGENPKKVKKSIEQYLQERVNGIPVGIDAKLIFILAKVNLKLKDEQEAEKLFLECIKLYSKDLHARLELGRLYAKQSKEKEAEELFIECMELDPNNLHARLELGKLYVKQGKEEEAEKLFQEYMKLDPNNLHARLELGKLYVKRGKEEEAEKLFQEYMALDPNNLHARLELGKLYVKQGKEEEAEKLFQEYMALDPNNLHARLELGRLYEKQGKEQEAEKLFAECIKLNSKEIYARLELGKLYAKQDKEKEAEELFTECIKLNTKEVYARLELGRLYVKQGKKQEAEKLFQEYMALDPNNLHARLELAILYKIIGKKEKSKQMIIECLEIDPNDKYAIDQLRKIQKDEETENCIDDAIKSKESVIKESTLASIEEIYRADSLAEKIRMCQAILEKDSDNVEVQMILQSLQEEAREEEEAKVEKESESYVLRKDGIADGLSCIVAKYFSEIPAEEIEESKKRFMYYRQKQPEEVTMETNKLVWYLRFRYKNYSILERFFRIKDNGEYEAMNSATIIIPNDVKIENGNIDKSQIPYIERQVHRGNYFGLLEQKIQKVEKMYLARSKEQDY